MKKTNHYKGHRWTNDELKLLMKMWSEDAQLSEISSTLNSSTVSILKQVQRMRKNGIPLAKRKAGHEFGIANRNWTQGEVEYLLRRRNEKASSEEIASEIGRSSNSVDAMIGKLKNEGVNVQMRGNGVRRLWDSESLKAVSMQNSLS